MKLSRKYPELVEFLICLIITVPTFVLVVAGFFMLGQLIVRLVN